MKNPCKSSPLMGLGLTAIAIMGFSPGPASADMMYATIQPHTSGNGYVVTYSWQGSFANGMDGGSNGGTAYIDDNTNPFSSDYQMASGNHPGSLIRYSQHNNDGINGNLFFVPPAGSGIAVHYDGTNGESLNAGDPMAESSHSNIGFTENGGDWYNNPNDFGGVRFFGTGIQGAESLTSWNGINASSPYGSTLGQPMQFGVNGSAPGALDTARFGMALDAKYVNDLGASGNFNGLLIGYFPYASNFPPNGTPDDLFLDQFNVGTYTSGGNIEMVIINDSTYVPKTVVPEPASVALLGFGMLALFGATRQQKR